MCGRYTLRTDPQALVEHFDAELATADEILPRYNIAPTQQVPIVRERSHGGRALCLARWGLIPSWATGVSGGQINARAETVSSTPMFRRAFQRGRCLVPADGYYEWLAIPGERRKQPYHLKLQADRLLAFAGIWERWQQGADRIDSFAIITCDACDAARAIHDRMPVFLAKTVYAIWLNPDTSAEDLGRLLVPYSGTDLVANAVATTVGTVRNDSPACLEPASQVARDPRVSPLTRPSQLRLF